MLALAPQCCCGGPGVMRASGAFLFMNHVDELQSGEGGWTYCLKRWPCWASPWAWNGCNGGKPLTFYDEANGHQWFLNGSSLGHLPRTNEFVIGSMLISRELHNDYGDFDALPAIVTGRIDDCQYVLPLDPPPTYSGGNLTPRTLLTVGQSFEVLDSFLASAAPDPANGYGGFSGVDAEFIYGFFHWDTYDADGDRTAHFQAFKLPHGSTTRTDLHAFTKTIPGIVTPNAFDGVPHTMNVQDSHCYNTRSWYDGDFRPRLRVFKDGGQVAEMRLGITLDGDDWAVGEVAGQMIALQSTLRAVIVEDGKDAADNLVRMIAKFPSGDDPDTEIELVPISLGYDYHKRALCIIWGSYVIRILFPELVPTYATYHSAPITPGNILANPHVRVYELFPLGSLPGDGHSGPSGGYLGTGVNQSAGWCHIIPGRMPRPLKVVAGHIVDPPPPPPPTPNCDGLTECAALPPLSLSLREFDDFEVPATFSPFSGKFHWLLTNLEAGYLLHYQPGTNFDFAIDLAIPGDYSAPGRLVQRWEDANPDYRLEHYVHRIRAHVVCADGAVAFDRIDFYLQEFLDLTGATELQPNASGILWQVINPLHSRAGRSLTCATTPFTSQFSYDHPLHNVNNDGPRDFWANGILGPIE